MPTARIDSRGYPRPATNWRLIVRLPAPRLDHLDGLKRRNPAAGDRIELLSQHLGCPSPIIFRPKMPPGIHCVSGRAQLKWRSVPQTTVMRLAESSNECIQKRSLNAPTKGKPDPGIPTRLNTPRRKKHVVSKNARESWIFGFALRRLPSLDSILRLASGVVRLIAASFCRGIEASFFSPVELV